MKLPSIVWTEFGTFIVAGTRARTGLSLSAKGGYVSVTFEFPRELHIKMNDYGGHIRIRFDAPTGTPNMGEDIPVHIPESEFEKARQESNPLTETRGKFFVQLTPGTGAGLTPLLTTIEVPQVEAEVKL